ncbi:hypothetical protein PV327_002821 [Microctonus hyperodae]|uniref:Uncharacterized protein n=1 Tax=Microctonus hyperodae TaxID=165561 RepID=A0AA39KPH1_MICHY|nr:hypothetical protein PV327_002821 [Microctonus hyperodae]
MLNIVVIAGACGHQKQFLEMANLIKQIVPQAEISGSVGRQGSYEVSIDDELIHSKLQTMAFPDFTEVSDIVKDVSNGMPIRKVNKHQPINCILM